jgi:protein O-mannosyl-transferase
MTLPQNIPKSVLYSLCLAVLVLLVYGSSLGHGFVWDDNYVIVNNPMLEKLSNIPRFFLSEDTIEESTGYYRPMTYVSFALERAVWGVNPLGYHLTNLLLHLTTALLFFGASVALFKKERLAFLAALILALHPVAAETVNFLSGGRNTLLSACFALLSLLCYVKKRPLAALASFTLAVFSKEFALLLPAVFLWYDCRLQREPFRLRRYLPYLVPIAGYLTLRSFAVQKANFLAALSFSDLVKAPYFVVRFALNMIAPVQLKVLYEVNPGMVSGVVCLVLLAAVLWVVYRFRDQEEVLLGSCWFFIFLLPVVNIIPLHTTTQMADRYAYFSLMGFALLLASLINRANGRMVTAGAVALGAVYGLVDIRQTGFWKNDITFFTQMTQDAPGHFAGFKNLGMGYFQKGDTAQALKYLALADAKPGISVKFLIGDAYLLWKENAPDLAEKALLRALELEPYNPEPYMILAMISNQKGDQARAQSYREKGKGLVNGIDEIMAAKVVEFCRSGEMHVARNQFKEADIALWQALQINPVYIPALVDMASLKADRGDFASAAGYLGRALAIDPLNAAAHHNLALVYQMQGRMEDSQREMTRYRELQH